MFIPSAIQSIEEEKEEGVASQQVREASQMSYVTGDLALGVTQIPSS